MPYFQHRGLIVEAEQFDPKTETPPPFVDDIEIRGKIICGTIKTDDKTLVVQPTDWVVYGRNSKRFVIKDNAFREFFQEM